MSVCARLPVVRPLSSVTSMDRLSERPVVVDDVTIEFRGRRSRRSTALRGVSLELGRNEVLGVVGESGSGKSALAAVLSARDLRTQTMSPKIIGGSITVLGTRLGRLGHRERDRLQLNIGYLPQDAADRLTPNLSVAENLAEPFLSRDRRYDRRELAMRVMQFLEAVRLPIVTMEKLPHELSSGQRQRVAIAKSLMLEPTLWIADEPTAGIDATVRDTVPELVHQIQQIRDFSAVIVSHDLSVTTQLADRIAVLYHGELVGYGEVDEVLANPYHPYVSGLAASRSHSHHHPPTLR